MKFNPAGRTNRRRLLGAGAAAVASIAGVSGASRVHAAATVKPWPEGRPPPPLRLTDLDGKPWRLEALTGQPVMLNFWATWCDPCRAEMPSLDALALRHERAGLVVLAVNYRESPLTIRRYLETQPVTMPILLDSSGEAANAWTPRVFPSTVLIDRSGTPRSTVVGDLDWAGSAARELIEPLLAKPRSA